MESKIPACSHLVHSYCQILTGHRCVVIDVPMSFPLPVSWTPLGRSLHVNMRHENGTSDPTVGLVQRAAYASCPDGVTVMDNRWLTLCSGSGSNSQRETEVRLCSSVLGVGSDSTRIRIASLTLGGAPALKVLEPGPCWLDFRIRIPRCRNHGY